MRILIVGPIPQSLGGKEYGGIATHIEGLVNHLGSLNHDVFLWYHKPQKSFVNNRVRVLRTNFLDYLINVFLCTFYFTNGNFNYLTIKQRFVLSLQHFRLKWILRRNVIDVIHIHSMHNTSSIALQLLKYKKVKYIISDHGFWQDEKASIIGSDSYKKLKKAVQACSQLIYISDYAKKKHIEIDFGQINKLTKIKNPIDIPKMKSKPKGDKRNKTIFFNGLTESIKIKRLDLLLMAIENDEYLRENTKVIALVNNEGHRFVKSKNFNFEIELLQPMRKVEIEKIYLKSDLLVLPSRSESFGLVYLEALSYGIPIIGFKEVVEEFKNTINEYIGEAFDSETESSYDLAKKITRTLNSDFDPKKVYNGLKKEYSWKENIKLYETLYKKVST